MEYHDYAADASPHFSSTITSSPSADNCIFRHRLRPIAMNSFSSSSASSQSPHSNDLGFAHNAIPPTSNSLEPQQQHLQMLNTAPSSVDNFDHELNNDNPSNANTNDMTASVQLTRRSIPSNMMQDYWHGQAPLLLNNSLRVHDLDNVEANHSERGIAGFVSKLYQSLQAPDNEQKYARWCKHDGKDMFIIECIPKFTEVVLPRLFKHCKFASFVRQLNIYGFQRDTDARKTKDTRDKESCRWYHPHFRPGRRDLFHLIRRKAARYPRRKRVKLEEDPETIVNIGDDSDSELLMNEDRPRSSSVSSSAVSQHHDSYPEPFPVGYGNLTPATPTSAAAVQAAAAAAAVQVASAAAVAVAAASTATTPPVQQQQQQQQHSQPHPHPQPQEQVPSSPPEMAMREHELQAHVMKVDQGYQRLVNQIKHAFDLIEAQSRRIQVLETELLRNQQQQQQQHPHRHSQQSHQSSISRHQQEHHHHHHHPAQQSQTRPSEMNYLVGNDNFTNHPSSNDELYTLFPQSNVRIKSEMAFDDNMLLPPSEDWVYHQAQFPSCSRSGNTAATIAAAAAAAVAAAANTEQSAPGGDLAFGLASSGKYTQQRRM